MSYKNPTIPLLTNPVGLDTSIQEIQQSLAAGLPWLEKAFGRAWLHSQDIAGKIVKIPKCYQTKGEYINVLPNDNLKAQVFFYAKGLEKYENYSSSRGGNAKSRDVSIIFWGNLKRIDKDKDYIFTEELKKQIEVVLMGVPSITSINTYLDENAEQIFSPFTLNDVDTQYLMYPYFGCRFEVTIKFFDAIC